MQSHPFIRSAPLRIVVWVLTAWWAVFLLTRVVLFFSTMQDWVGRDSLSQVAMVFLHGWLYDAAFLVYAGVLMGSVLLVLPSVVWRTRPLWISGLLFVLVYIMLFVGVSEWFFWEEFGSRFNFIAVDYLVYSDEVISNIRESYPLPSLLSGIGLVALCLVIFAQGFIRNTLAFHVQLPRKQVLVCWLASLMCSGLFTMTLDQRLLAAVSNAYLRDLGANGPYQFFAAYRNNVLDYDQFYATEPDTNVAHVLRAEMAESNATFTGTDRLDVRRTIENPGTPRPLNVVLVTIESLSAKYLGSKGDTRGLTPHLDALRKQSLYFNNLYATGTRTDRGLEAITLSMPPTPGRSIVKRIGHESGYGSLGQQLHTQGYDSVFVYGGRGYFDNMNAFFSGNGYRVVDQSSVQESDIHFKNAWGMADEDLYSQAIRVADADYAGKQPFFLHLMTTSNHRPYTYPDGRIDIPSGMGREGAVKYTDYAIHTFLTEAKKKPWFDDTLFIFVADHCAGSAGSEDLPVEKYHIPMWVYAPKWVNAKEFSDLTSQIDIAPTLLGLLKMDYESTFFGRDVLNKGSDLPSRILIGNYQHLGLFDGRDLAILSPGKRMRKHLDALGRSEEVLAGHDDPLMMREIAYYQAASYDWKQGLLAWKEPARAGEVFAIKKNNGNKHAL